MNFIFGVCDRGQVENTVLFISNFLCVLNRLLSIYCSVNVLFVLKVEPIKERDTVQIFNIFNKLLCEIELRQSWRGCDLC